jgi:glycosyltransferase involved in cell wall biosynthesis
MPDSKHLMTCQNPKTKKDWKKVNRFYPLRRRAYNTLIEPFVSKRIKDLDAVYCQCKYISEKAATCYSLDSDLEFLPNPVHVLNDNKKKGTSQACFLGRFDGEKNPEKFFELAEMVPEVSFVAAGRSHDKQKDKQIRETNRLPNLSLPGHLSGREKDQLLETSWVLVNISVTECLPVSFPEAASAGCAILSPHDPDGFSSNFGYRVNEDYVEGINWLLDGNRWRVKGKTGREYVKTHHEFEKVIKRHIRVYEELIS